MPKVLVSDKLSKTAVQIFKDNNIEVDYLPDLGKDKDKLFEVIGQYDGLAIRSATKSDSAAPSQTPRNAAPVCSAPRATPSIHSRTR